MFHGPSFWVYALVKDGYDVTLYTDERQIVYYIPHSLFSPVFQRNPIYSIFKREEASNKSVKLTILATRYICYFSQGVCENGTKKSFSVLWSFSFGVFARIKEGIVLRVLLIQLKFESSYRATTCPRRSKMPFQMINSQKIIHV